MLLELLVLGIVIGANNLAAALALGALGQGLRRLRIVCMFGAFEFAVPLAGIWLGRQVSALVTDQIAWLAPALLAAMGLWAIAGAFTRSIDEEALAERAATWRGLALLAAGLSLDNLVVGFSLGLGNWEPLLLAATIALCSMAFAWLGLRLGATARRDWGRAAECGAGAMLILLAGASATGWL